jgi:hypothetical protein
MNRHHVARPLLACLAFCALVPLAQAQVADLPSVELIALGVTGDQLHIDMVAHPSLPTNWPISVRHLAEDGALLASRMLSASPGQQAFRLDLPLTTEVEERGFQRALEVLDAAGQVIAAKPFRLGLDCPVGEPCSWTARAGIQIVNALPMARDWAERLKTVGHLDLAEILDAQPKRRGEVAELAIEVERQVGSGCSCTFLSEVSDVIGPGLATAVARHEEGKLETRAFHHRSIEKEDHLKAGSIQSHQASFDFSCMSSSDQQSSTIRLVGGQTLTVNLSVLESCFEACRPEVSWSIRDLSYRTLLESGNHYHAAAKFEVQAFLDGVEVANRTQAWVTAGLAATPLQILTGQLPLPGGPWSAPPPTSLSVSVVTTAEIFDWAPGRLPGASVDLEVVLEGRGTASCAQSALVTTEGMRWGGEKTTITIVIPPVGYP